MSFSKSRFKSNYQYELLRYCNLLNTSVVGAASRLLKSFIKQHNPKSIVSYSQVRLFDGNVYQQMGFKLSHRAAPGYFWWINKSGIHIKSRHQTQVHKLIADENNKSERAIMVRDGYRRVWDCGNDVWCYNLT